jgi:cytoskeletal protein CcmA (bactofilin family)
LRTSRVWGDINATAITTEEGAFIDGKITMVRHDASIQSFEPASLPQPGAIPQIKEGAADEDIEVVVGEAVDDDA